MASLTRSLRLSSPRRRTMASMRFNSSTPIFVATVASLIRGTPQVYNGKPSFEFGDPTFSRGLAYVLCLARLGRLGFLVRALLESIINLLCLIFQLLHLDL